VAACVLAAALGIAAFSLANFGGDVPATDAVVLIDSADFVRSSSTRPPRGDAGWTPEALPDDWESSRPGVHGDAWYRVRFDLRGPPEQPQAVLLSVFRTTGAVYVNGTYVGRTGPLEKPERSRRPQLFSIPPSLLHAGPNFVHLRLRALDGWPGLLSRLRVGDETVLRREYERQFLLRVTGPQMICGFALVVGVCMLALWWQRRRESTYGYFGASALLFSAFIASYFVRESPLSDVYWTVVAESSLAGSLVLLCLLALRLAGRHLRRPELVLWAYATVTPMLVRAGQGREGLWIAENWGFVSQGIAVVPVALFVAMTWRRPTVSHFALALTSLGAFATSIREHLFSYPGDLPPLLPYSYVPLYLVIGWVLLDGFVRSLNESERLNLELAGRVARTDAQLEQNQQRVQEVERQQSVVEERNRIMRDMHDGVGAQLIATLSMVERGAMDVSEVAAALRDCLDNLRLTIDSLEPTDDDLLPVLGNLRYRLDSRLRRQGIDLDWQVEDVPRMPCLTPQNVLHLLRILQEAFTNVLKHAHASAIRVQTGVDPDRGDVFIRVRDDGTGFVGGRVGRGIANMKRRAQLIGADIEILPSSRGTTITIFLPLA
jgi:signal transduction histidine kinase